MKDIEAAQKEAKKARREAQVVAKSREAAAASLIAAEERREACVSLCELLAKHPEGIEGVDPRAAREDVESAEANVQAKQEVLEEAISREEDARAEEEGAAGKVEEMLTARFWNRKADAVPKKRAAENASIRKEIMALVMKDAAAQAAAREKMKASKAEEAAKKKAEKKAEKAEEMDEAFEERPMRVTTFGESMPAAPRHCFLVNGSMS